MGLGVAEPGGEHDLGRDDRLAGKFEPEIVRRGVRLDDCATRQIGAASLAKAFMQRVQQVQRVGMAVIGRPGGAGDRRTEPRQNTGELASVQHAVFEAEIAGLAPHLLHHGAAFLQLFFAEAQLQAAGLLQPHRDAGPFAEFCCESRPFLGREPGPALVMGRAETL